jgi:hypothetical protein
MQYHYEFALQDIPLDFHPHPRRSCIRQIQILTVTCEAAGPTGTAP